MIKTIIITLIHIYKIKKIEKEFVGATKKQSPCTVLKRGPWLPLCVENIFNKISLWWYGKDNEISMS